MHYVSDTNGTIESIIAGGRRYSTNVTVSAINVLNGTFSITRKTDLKYSSCCGSVELDFSHARLTV